MEFSRQKYWSGLSFPSPEDLPNPEIKPRSPEWQADSSLSDSPGKPFLWWEVLKRKLNPILGHANIHPRVVWVRIQRSESFNPFMPSPNESWTKCFAVGPWDVNSCPQTTLENMSFYIFLQNYNTNELQNFWEMLENTTYSTYSFRIATQMSFKGSEKCHKEKKDSRNLFNLTLDFPSLLKDRN